MIFHDEFVAESSSLKYGRMDSVENLILIPRSVLDYWVEIQPLSQSDRVSIVLTGKSHCNSQLTIEN